MKPIPLIMTLLLTAGLIAACRSAADPDGRTPESETAPKEAAAPPTAAPTTTPENGEFYADWLPVLGSAPEIDNEVWINSEPLTMAALEGKVVLVEFWTFG